jgi:hypothetical protein
MDDIETTTAISRYWNAADCIAATTARTEVGRRVKWPMAMQAVTIAMHRIGKAVASQPAWPAEGTGNRGPASSGRRVRQNRSKIAAT